MSEKIFAELQEKINIAKQNNQPYDMYVKQQIRMLEDLHDELIREAKKKGYDINSPQLAQVELTQYAAMINLSAEIGLPTEKYDKEVQRILLETMGEEAYNQFIQQFPEN